MKTRILKDQGIVLKKIMEFENAVAKHAEKENNFEVKSGRDSSKETESAEKYVASESLKQTRILGPLVLDLVESYSKPENSLKMAMTNTKYSSMKITGKINLFPNGSSKIKAIFDVGANIILWKGKLNKLIPNKIKEQVESSLKKRGVKEVANALFDCLFGWPPLVKDTEETDSADSKEIDTFVGEILFLLAKNVDIERRERQKHSTPLMLAAIFMAEKAIVELFRRGAKPNVANKEGYTALHWAARNERGEILCEILLKEGADVNLQNNSGNTALHFGAQRGRNKVVKLLLKSVKNPEQLNSLKEMKNSDGKSAEELGTRECANSIRIYRLW